MNRQEFHFFIARRSLSSSSVAIAWKKKQTTAVLFIVRILIETRAYFSTGQLWRSRVAGTIGRSGAILMLQREGNVYG
jgi:hypothetical protein